MNLSPSKYQHSGAIGSSLLIVPLAGILASLVLGLAYAYITVYSPIAGWISILFVMGYAVAVGMVVAVAARAAKCRNQAVAGLLGALVGLCALYSAWAYFLFVLMRRENPPVVAWSDLPLVFASPVADWNIIQIIGQNGWFEMGGRSFSGIPLWICWFLEAAIIVGLITNFGRTAIADEVFCERCRRWAEDGEKLWLAVPEKMEELRGLADGDLKGLFSLDPVPVWEYPRMQVETKRCSSCQETATCKIKAMSQETDKEGKTVEKANDLTGLLVITRQEYEALAALASRPIPADLEDPEPEDLESDELPDESDEATGTSP